MNRLITFARSIEDFRLDRKKLHPVENIVFITVLAVICGAQDWEEIEDFGNSRKEFLSGHLNLENGIPSHDTFNRFFSLFNPQRFQDLFLSWLHELICLPSTEGKQVAIDGKSNRGSGTGKKKMLHLLHAYLVENECLLAQKKTEDKSNEITAIPILLDALELKEALVSIDAMGCQKEIAEKILEKKTDYFLAVKQNQKTLHEDIEVAFSVFEPTSDNLFETVEINGSRIEKRTCKVMRDLSHLTTATQWSGLKCFIKVETEVYSKTTKQTTTDCHYYITNRECGAKDYLAASRKHWKIENNLHWSLDVIFKEDQSRKRNNNVAENFSIILKIILNLLKQKQQTNKKVSIKRMRKRAAWNLDYLLQLLDF